MEERNSETRKGNNNVNVTKKVLDGITKGEKAFDLHQGYKYVIKYNNSKSCAVKVVDTTLKGKNNWVFRIDGPHPNVDFNHVNINPKISGFKDPHIQIPPGSLTAADKIGKACTAINKVVVPVAIALDTVRVGYSIHEDYKNNSTRNTVETVASIGGAWGGGFGGAAGGAAIGTAILPGVGTIIGGIVGGITGGIGGTWGASKITETVADNLEYGIAKIKCKNCHNVFVWKRYKGEKHPEKQMCPKCLKNI